MSGTFKDCTSLTGTITINANPTSISQCFDGVDFAAQNLTLAGTSSMLDALGTTGKNYCADCNGRCNLNPDDGSTPINGDTYEYGDYVYTYQTTAKGWQVAINTAVTNKNKTSYSPILESINGEPITNISNLFSGCALLKTAPTIPDSVTSMGCAFQGCTSLTRSAGKEATELCGCWRNCPLLCMAKLSVNCFI